MGTRLTVAIETKMSIDEVRNAVAALDAADSEPEEGIAPENVTAWDVIQYVVSGDLALVRLIDKVEYHEDDIVPDLRRALNEAGGDMHLAFDGVTVNKMEVI